MSIASTRKVSGSPNAPSKADYYRRGGNGESLVENIDKTKNVLVNNNTPDNRENRQDSPFQKPKEEKNNRTKVSTPGSYVSNALEALAASGVYDDVREEERNTGSNPIGVYDNNQSIVRAPEREQFSHHYLKHFYERNEIIEEVDELV